jgi:hypothetical protein
MKASDQKRIVESTQTIVDKPALYFPAIAG